VSFFNILFICCLSSRIAKQPEPLPPARPATDYGFVPEGQTYLVSVGNGADLAHFHARRPRSLPKPCLRRLLVGPSSPQ
jgi:hypothetical protein